MQLPAPRVVLVLAGASTVMGMGSTPLEQARMPHLAALGHSGRVGRLRTVAQHLPIGETTAAAALLGTVPPVALDPGAVAAEALGRLLATDECCTLVDVVDHAGEPAPALDVQRAVDALRHQLAWHRIVGIRNGHQVLIAGGTRPVLPLIDGLDLRPADHGFLPSRQLDASTVVVAAEGSTLLGVASLLGAQVEGVDAARGMVHDPVPSRLRSRAIRALIGGARTVVVESRAPLEARRGPRGMAGHAQAVRACLEALDRELVGPLGTAAAWMGASLAVTADLARRADGAAVRGEVPIVMAGPRSVFTPEPAPLLAPLGTTLPPRYCERAVAGAPIVASPFTIVPSAGLSVPRRFTRDPRSGRTFADEVALL